MTKSIKEIGEAETVEVENDKELNKILGYLCVPAGAHDTIRCKYVALINMIGENNFADTCKVLRKLLAIKNEKTTKSPYKKLYLAFATWTRRNWSFSDEKEFNDENLVVKSHSSNGIGNIDEKAAAGIVEKPDDLYKKLLPSIVADNIYDIINILLINHTHELIITLKDSGFAVLEVANAECLQTKSSSQLVSGKYQKSNSESFLLQDEGAELNEHFEDIKI